MADNAPNGLTPKQEEAIAALMTETTVEAAAKKIDVGERTLYRWMGEPVFRAEYQRCRREAFGKAIALLQRYAAVAANTLASIAHDRGAPPSARVQASNAVLKHCRDAIELDDLAARVQMQEEQQKQREDKR